MTPSKKTGHNFFERSTAERQASALGLARVKVGRGEVEQAKAIARQFRFDLSDIGPAQAKSPVVKAA